MWQIDVDQLVYVIWMMCYYCYFGGQDQGFVDVVGDEDDGVFVMLLQGYQFFLYFYFGLCIEGGEGFVYQDY